MRAFFALLTLALATLAAAQGGPPLLTDDPGTVDPGKWEINVAWIHRQLPGRVENEVPHFDAAHGFTRNAQFKLEVPWVIASEGGPAVSGDGGFSTGVKWRFLDAKGARPAISTYPQIGFSLAPRSVRLGLSEGGTSLLIPLQVEWDLNSLSVNPDLGLLFRVGGKPGWLGGVAIGHAFGSTDLLAEIHGEGVFSTGEANWVAQLGLRYDFGERSTLLFAFGRTIASSNSDPLRWTSYLGIQIHC